MAEPNEFVTLLEKHNLMQFQTVFADNENSDELMSWLQIHNQPKSKMIDYWEKTTKRRLVYIRESKPNLNEIWAQWPRYSDKDGHILIAQDFSKLHPESGDSMAAMWPSLWPKLSSRLNAKQIKDKDLKTSVSLLISDDTSSEWKSAATMVLLPVLLPEASVTIPSVEVGDRGAETRSSLGKRPRLRNQVTGKGNGKSRKALWKLSIIESMEHFVDIQEPGLDVERYIEEKAAKLRRHNLTLQPHVVVLSEDLTNVPDAVFFAVLQNRVFYQCQSLLEAVDVCVKASFVFNLTYAPASYSSWLFLQREVYQINTVFDSMPVKVLALQSDIRAIAN